jgi:hypothetical protein
VLQEWIAGTAADARANGIGVVDLCWAAARLAIEAGARAILAARNETPVGRLFARPVAGASNPAMRALELLAGRAPPPLDAADFATLGAAYPALLPAAGRKSSGAWFTPPALTEPTVRRTLEPLLRRVPTPRVGDLAVGAGSFLVATLRWLADHTDRPPAAIAAEQLFGIDADPTAVGLAAWTLREACGAAAPPLEVVEAHRQVGDGLRAGLGGKLDAVVGNPPWETLQSDRHGQVASPHDPRADAARRRELRAGFLHQGRGKLYTYRLFVERALQLLDVGGRLGMLVPASIYYDCDAASLRELLLQDNRWEWLFGFENRDRLFPIDSRYRFAALIAEKGSSTAAVQVAFRRADPAEWAAAAPRHLLYTVADLRRSSPRSGAFVELDDERDWRLEANAGGCLRPAGNAAASGDSTGAGCSSTAPRQRQTATFRAATESGVPLPGRRTCHSIKGPWCSICIRTRGPMRAATAARSSGDRRRTQTCSSRAT